MLKSKLILTNPITKPKETRADNDFFSGVDLPLPMHDVAGHIADVSATHLRVALDEKCAGKDYGVVTKIDYSTVFDMVAKAFPKAVEEGVFKKGTFHPLPVEYDSSETVELMGGFKSFESAVVEVAAQYLELLGKEKA